MANELQQLIRYVERQWINKRSVGPERLSVRDKHSRTNNVLESYHAALRRRVKVSHPNLYTFLGHLHHLTCDQLNDVARIRNALNLSPLATPLMVVPQSKRKSGCATGQGGIKL